MSIESNKNINSILNSANQKLVPLQKQLNENPTKVESLVPITNFLKEANLVFTKLSERNVNPDVDIDEELKTQLLQTLNLFQQDRSTRAKMTQIASGQWSRFYNNLKELKSNIKKMKRKVTKTEKPELK